MNTRRLGCLSFSSLLTAFLTVLALGIAGWVSGGVMFNPGALNAQEGPTLGGVRSHAELAGRCSACHTRPWEQVGLSDRCLECHTDVRSPQDFHAVMLAEATTRGCSDCHTDHNGKTASLTIMDLARFPHESTGYSLTGHQKNADGSSFACSDCHLEDFAVFNKELCADCHIQLDATTMQKHNAAFGTGAAEQGCLACHDGVDTYSADFDHNAVAFPLEGQHAVIDCASCHVEANTLQALTSLPTDCFACHAEDDTHKGQFGKDCAACHTSVSWEDATFDHSLADFPLTGAHQNVACEDCHQDNVFKGTPQECVACHADPQVHLGLFSTDCQSCHTTAAWKPARFEMAHTFPIDHGEEGPTECRVCHPDQLQTYTCYGCHEHNPAEIAEKHQEEGIPDFNDCMRCHPTGQKDEGREGDDD